MQLLILVHLLAASFMTGLIWFVQLVHYPLMSRIPAPEFPAFEADHRRRVTWIVTPMMGLELATACSWLYASPARTMPLLNLAALAAIWLLTFFVQVPQHIRLTRGFDAEVHASLVRGNWWRTALWSLRSVLVLLAAV